MPVALLKRVFSDPYACAKGVVFLGLAYLCLGLMLPGILSLWQDAHTVSTLDLTPAARTRLVASLADKVARRYLDARKGAQVALALRKAEEAGWYDAIASPNEFARALTRDLRDASGDLHISVQFSPAEVPDFGDRNFPPPRKDDLSLPAWSIDRLGRWLAKFGLDEVSRSDAGIGYIRLGGFVRPYLSAEKYAAAMDRVADTRGLIIDLRDNSGGNRDAVALLASYFFDQPTLLSEVEAPRTGERIQMWTRKDVDGKHYGSSRPVYILSSHATFSAGEDFAYAMQTRGRATIVGEVSQGGAHPVAPFRLDRHFILMLPVAQTVSPVTQSNWEGVGVQPDIVVSSDRARSVATIALLKRQLAAETDSVRRARIQAWLQQER